MAVDTTGIRLKPDLHWHCPSNRQLVALYLSTCCKLPVAVTILIQHFCWFGWGLTLSTMAAPATSNTILST